MIPDMVMNEAIEKANLEIEEVFSLAFVERLREKRHSYNPDYHRDKTNPELINGSCQCDYCKALRNYVELKMEHHRTQKRLHNDDMVFMSEISGIETTLEDLKIKAKKAKKEKDRIKKDLKI